MDEKKKIDPDDIIIGRKIATLQELHEAGAFPSELPKEALLAPKTTKEISEYCTAVGILVHNSYGMDDGSDLCYTMIEQGAINPNKDTDKYAAYLVAQRLMQP